MLNRQVSIKQSIKEKKDSLPFILILIYLFFEYVRPQTIFPPLAALHIPMFIQIALILALVTSSQKITWRNPQTKYFICLVFLMAIHIPIAANNRYAYWMTKYQLLYLMIYLCIITFIESIEKISIFFNAWLLINLSCALIGSLQGGRMLSSGFMSDENDFALVMNMAIPFGYFMFLYANSLAKKIIYLLSVFIFIIANLISFSRGGFVGLIPVIIYCLFKTPKKLSALILLAILVVFFLVMMPTGYLEEMNTIITENVEEGTGKSRWYFWKISLRMFADNPIIGVGPHNWPYNVSKYEKEVGYLQGRSWAGFVPHSLYFELIPELGLIGIILFLGILYHLYKDIKWFLRLEKIVNKNLSRNTDRLGKKQAKYISELYKIRIVLFSCNGAIIGYLVSGIFISVFYYPHFWLLLGFIAVVINLAQRNLGNFQSIRLKNITT